MNKDLGRVGEPWGSDTSNGSSKNVSDTDSKEQLQKGKK